MIIVLIIIILLILLLSKSNFTQISSIPIYVISLERAKERKEYISNLLKDSNFIYFKAVDGLALTPEETEFKNKYMDDSNLSKGGAGCTLSHMLLWNKLVNEPYDHFVVFEDDIVPNYPIDLILEIVSKVDKEYDLLYIGQCFEHQGQLVQTIILENKNFSIYKSVYPLCTHAYVISKSGINKLLKYLETNKVGKIIDHFLGGLYQQGVINSLSFMQTLVDQPWQKSDSNLKLETYNK